MPEPRKHHYVPRFYQRGFMADASKKIWVYQKDRKPQRCSTKKTGMEIDLYAFRNAKGEVDLGTVEKELGLLDDRAAKVIQKLERGKHPTARERARLCKFVSIMWRRTPKHKDYVNKIAVELLSNVLEPLDKMGSQLSTEARAEVERIRREYSAKPPDFLFPHNVLRESAFERFMYKMDWAFFKSLPGKEFLTCDDPTRVNGAGLKNKDAVILFPLSRKLFLHCKWNSGWGNTFHFLSNEKIDYLNLWIVKGAHKQVYSSENSEEIRLLVDEQIRTID
jgi:hypothetical protein